MRKRVVGAALFACMVYSSQASAAPVIGQISFGGYADPVGSTAMGSATGISFADATGSSVAGTSGLLSTYGGGTGSFAALGFCGSTTTGCGTIKDIANFATQGPLTDFLSFLTGGPAVSFDLTSISDLSHITNDAGGSVTFKALGVLNFTGYDSTPGAILLTAQGNNITSFSATALAAEVSAVPELSTWAMMLLGLGLVGGAMRSAKRKQKLSVSYA